MNVGSTIRLTLICAGSAFLLLSCKLSTSNSFTDDSNLGTQGSLVDSTGKPYSEAFLLARQVMKANCGSCHGEMVQYSEEQFINIGLVIPKEPENSDLYRRLRGANVGGPENMPQLGALSSGDRAAIYSWIRDIQTSDAPGSGPSGEPTAADRRSSAVAIIGAKCATCHSTTKTATSTGSTGYQGATVPAFSGFSSASDAPWVTSGLIEPGDSGESWLFRALKGAGDIGTMPKTAGVSLNSQEIETIRAWIDGIGQP